MQDETHIMLDIETMGTGRDARVIAVGAAQFDPVTGLVNVGRSTEFSVSDPTGVATDATREWWSDPDRAEARAYLKGLKTVGAWHVFDVVTRDLSLSGLSVHDTFWWAKSPTFDMAILEDLGVRTGAQMPWHFRNLRDVRTIMHASGLEGFDWSDAAAPLHSPLADCEVQARHVGQAMRELRG